MSLAVQEELRLEIIKSDYKFGFYFDNINDNRVWIISHNRIDPEYFIVTERRDGEIVDVRNVRYDEVGPEVRDLCTLYVFFVTKPDEAVRKVIGEDVNIVSVVIKNISEKYQHGFEMCSFSL
jgi:hypothetical protein